MGLLDDVSAVVHLASVTRVGGHARGKSSWVDTYVRTVLDSFGKGADADTKRGIFVDRLNALKAQKGVITEEDVTELRKSIEDMKASIDAIERLKRKRKDRAGGKNPLINTAKLSQEEDSALVKLGRLNWSPKENWVDQEHGLPKYIEDIAIALMRDHGYTRSRAIATAVNRVKKWAAGGDNVKPDTRVKAIAALAEWEKKKASAKARPNKS